MSRQETALLKKKSFVLNGTVEASGDLRYLSVTGNFGKTKVWAKAVAKKIGKVEVDMGDTSCKVPLAWEYIEKMQKTGGAFKKRKTFKC